MKATLVILLSACMFCDWLVTIIVIACTFACEADEYSVRVEKCTKAWANEESYKILYNNELLAISEAFTNNAVRSYYHCIPKRSSGKYTLEMIDRYIVDNKTLRLVPMIPGPLVLTSVCLDLMVSSCTLESWLSPAARSTISTVGDTIGV